METYIVVERARREHDLDSRVRPIALWQESEYLVWVHNKEI